MFKKIKFPRAKVMEVMEARAEFESTVKVNFEKAAQRKLQELAPDQEFKFGSCINCPGSCKCDGDPVGAIYAGEYGGSWAGSVWVD